MRRDPQTARHPRSPQIAAANFAAQGRDLERAFGEKQRDSFFKREGLFLAPVIGVRAILDARRQGPARLLEVIAHWPPCPPGASFTPSIGGLSQPSLVSSKVRPGG